MSARDEDGATPLHRAVTTPWNSEVPLPCPEMARTLLERGADVRAVDSRGETPLGFALRLPQFSRIQRETRTEIVAMLKAAGAPAHGDDSAVDDRPLPIDMAVARRVAEAKRIAASEACRAAGIPDGSGWLTELVRPKFDSYQEFIAELRNDADPDHVRLIPELCAEMLGDDARTDRTLIGDQRTGAPFFRHGDLVVKGHLDVVAPFVVTGSLTVEGCLADCGPESVVAVGGDVTAHAVHTDGEMSVGGDIEAEVVYGYYNDRTLQTGTIRARLVIEDEHCTIATVEADTHFDLDDYQQGYGDGVQEHLRELLVDQVFSNEEDEDDEQLDRTLLFARLRGGEAVFRANDATAR
ncbi:ankyrin repeat domain-containing protein [Streptomyces atratus]|uniref:ankyrin repeat domain-containing protein n=1 Tax=Streptomyces atratus TaxID=1893 RepID=UPI0016715A3E|nr:ankyrin repeat domain-containing protein [Streptomyces atratus]